MILRFVANRHGSGRSMMAAAATATATSGLGSSSSSTAQHQHQQQQRRSKHTTVAVQLDYYMSPQFAGIACALTEGLYEKAGIDTVKFLSICPVGLEMERVRQFRDISDVDVVVGSVEQNVFLPLLLRNPDLKLKAVAAMFNTSPLCLTSIVKENGNNNANADNNAAVVGAHEDTVDLLKRIMIYDNYDNNPQHTVISSPRETKITDLLEGRLDFIQAYTTTEVPTLERIVLQNNNTNNNEDSIIKTIPLEGFNGAKLGYSQMLFAPEEDLLVDDDSTRSDDKREILQAFLEATFEGWTMAINDNEHGAYSVEKAKNTMLNHLNDENNDHWDNRRSPDDFHRYNVHSTGACCDLVQATAVATSSSDSTSTSTRYGVIDPKRWDEATKWLLNEDVRSDFGLDSTVWQHHQ